MNVSELDDPTKPSRDPENPWLPAEPCLRHGQGQVRVWCRYCDRYHYHGLQAPGAVSHRAAHCWIDDSPYKATGYSFLVLPEGTVPTPRKNQRRSVRRLGNDRLHGWTAEPSVPWGDAVAAQLSRINQPGKEAPMTTCHQCGKETDHTTAIASFSIGGELQFCDWICAVATARDVMQDAVAKMKLDEMKADYDSTPVHQR